MIACDKDPSGSWHVLSIRDRQEDAHLTLELSSALYWSATLFSPDP